MVDPLARAWPDDRSVVVLRQFAVDPDDVDVVRASLEALIAALDRGYGRDSHFAFSTIATDAARPRDLRLRAIDGLTRFASGRLTGAFVANERVRVSADEAVPARLVADVRARLEALTKDADALVAERARSALGR